MCGISGILLNSTTRFNESHADSLRVMKESQESRGPDFSCELTGEMFGLAHNRLSIIDLSESGNQPMEYENHLLVFNGEIYNYAELKRKLVEEGVSFEGTSDSEVLLKSLVIKGIDETLSSINGIFAFCLYNKETGEFNLARDRMGEKPLFYYQDEENNLYFSSNPGAIVKALPQREWTLDLEATWQYFLLGGIFTDLTLFSGIKRLDSASVITGSGGSIEIRRYWSPKFRPGLTVQQVEASIEKAILSKTVSEVPITLFLSGGVDSSLVAAVIKKIDAVHLISPEQSHAAEIAKLFKMKFSVVRPHNFDIVESLLEYSDFSGEATMAGFIPYVTSKEVSKDYKVAISANGADELFFGYVRIPTPNIPVTFFDRRNARTHLNIDSRSLSERDQVFNIFRHPNNFLVHGMGSTKSESDVFNLISPILSELSPEFPSTSKYRWLELMTYVKGDLNPTLDFSSMANSLEVRAPFLDHELVSVALSLPENQHISSKFGRKHFLKKMLNGRGVNERNWNREKIGFSLTDEYLSSIESLKDTAVSDLANEGYVTISCIKEQSGRDSSYLRSAALGFWCWKKVWIDSGLVKK
jgi:asparagine synthase (glutamine-hydrolysing)